MEGKLSGLTCNECGIMCPTPSKLKRHMIVHSGLKPYSCPFCNKGFTQKGSMKRHEISHILELS